MITQRARHENLFFLLFASPLLGEMLSGSAPPHEWLNPLGALIMVCFYGCGTILIREAKARWRLQWSVILLAVAYGIIEEGIMMQSFFNHNHEDLNKLSGYGMLFGIQWPWTIMLIIYHATISTLIPITMAECLWPKTRYKPLLGKLGLALAFLGFLLPTILVMIFIWSAQQRYAVPYVPNLALMLGSAGVVLILVWLAYRFRFGRIVSDRLPLWPPMLFAVSGLIIQLSNLLFPNIMAELKVDGKITALFQLVGVGMLIAFVKLQIFHNDATSKHMIFYVFGTVLAFILLTPLHELGNGMPGMLIVGFVFLLLLFFWTRYSLMNRSRVQFRKG